MEARNTTRSRRFLGTLVQLHRLTSVDGKVVEQEKEVQA